MEKQNTHLVITRFSFRHCSKKTISKAPSTSIYYQCKSLPQSQWFKSKSYGSRKLELGKTFSITPHVWGASRETRPLA